MRIKWLIILVTMLAMSPAAWAVKVADITRISAQRTNILTGLGLVVGLKGTGDGGDFKAAIGPLASMLGKFSDPVTVQDLANVQNVALVSLTATVKTGARAGDRIDVFATSIGAASSLQGGRLFVTPMGGPRPGMDLFAMAEGRVDVVDPASPLTAIVKGGAVLEVDMPATGIKDGQFTLVLEEPAASWTTASTIAKIINDAEGDGGETLAVARDSKSVDVTIPQNERERPDSFISRVQRLPVPQLPSEARVIINEQTGTMVFTGDVEISPVVISHKGLTISTVTPPPTPTPRTPVTTEKNVIALDTTNTGGAKLQDLVQALDQLKVPAEDRITIVRELYKTGKLHAKLVEESR